jgi:hypothetical protein
MILVPSRHGALAAAAAPQSQQHAQGVHILDVVVSQSAPVLQLLARKDETMLVGGDACA